MTTAAIRTVVALDAGLDATAVQAALPAEGALDFVRGVEIYDDSYTLLDDVAADVVLVACDVGSESVLGFIGGAVRQKPNRPVVVLVAGSPNGYARRLFEAGADDFVSMTDPGSREHLVAAIQKAVARRSGSSAGRSAKQGEMICVVGPKGGSGKTVTTCNLAVALAAESNTVTVVDLDLQFGDVGLAMGLSPSRTIFDLAKSGGSLDPGKLEDYLTVHPSGAGVLIAPTRPEHAQAIGLDFLGEILRVARSMSDYVVVDTPPRMTPEVRAAIDASSGVCLVGMLDALSLKTTKLATEELDRIGYDRSRIRLVLNRADSRVGIMPGDVAAIVGRQPDVLVPSHREVALSVNEGIPITAAHPRSEAAKAFRALAKSYTERAELKSAGRRRVLGRRR